MTTRHTETIAGLVHLERWYIPTRRKDIGYSLTVGAECKFKDGSTWSLERGEWVATAAPKGDENETT